MFNEFDLFKPYKGEELSDHCLYIVKATEHNAFFNKRFNLCYGLFLKKFVSVTVEGTVCKTRAAVVREARELRQAGGRALEG